MYKIVTLMVAVLWGVMVSGCAMVSRHTAPVEGGTKTTVGFLGFDAIDHGYPLLPFYSGFNQGK
ncbi:MAG TPA: hypothetical protein PKM57_08185 [Kiritimatiellia bacterium]|nr:hypothetical protein [Kiritimatiellia bacterium]HPS06674.1 hypothetical protein [Kiritimatiellia bacterium]